MFKVKNKDIRTMTDTLQAKLVVAKPLPSTLNADKEKSHV